MRYALGLELLFGGNCACLRGLRAHHGFVMRRAFQPDDIVACAHIVREVLFHQRAEHAGLDRGQGSEWHGAGIIPGE